MELAWQRTPDWFARYLKAWLSTALSRYISRAGGYQWDSEKSIKLKATPRYDSGMLVVPKSILR
jgi:hypothetical protein